MTLAFSTIWINGEEQFITQINRDTTADWIMIRTAEGDRYRLPLLWWDMQGGNINEFEDESGNVFSWGGPPTEAA